MARSFSSFGAFAAYLRQVERSAAQAERHAIDEGSKVFLDAVTAIPGHYQDGWATLTEVTQADRTAKGYPADDPLRRTGGLADSYQREVTDHRHAVVGSNDERAIWFELGTSRMPARPVLHAAEAQQGDHIAHVMARRIHMHIIGSSAGG